MGQTQIFMKITTIYSKNFYDFVTFTTQILIFLLFTINFSNFHENLNLSHSYIKNSNFSNTIFLHVIISIIYDERLMRDSG